MKKALHIISLILVIAVAAISLCSCQELDKKKADRAVYNDDRSEITYHDHTYKMIKPGKFDFIDNNSVNWDSHYATDADVPVLLADTHGDYMQVYKDEIMLRVNGNSKDFMSAASTADNQRVGKDDLPAFEEYGYSSYYYVRTDKYDEVKKTIDDAKLDHYYFEYWSDYYDDAEYAYEEYNNSIPYAGGGQYQVLLNDALTAAVNKALNAATNDKVSYKELSAGAYDVREIILNPCDQNMVLTQSTGQCYLIEDRGRYYFWDGNYYQEYSIVPFSEEESALVKELFDQYPDAADYGDITWQFTDLTGSTDVTEPIEIIEYDE